MVESPRNLSRRRLFRLTVFTSGFFGAQWIVAPVAGTTGGSFPPSEKGRNAIQKEPRLTAGLNLKLRRRIASGSAEGPWAISEKEVSWDPRETAIVIVDMWDDHHCRTAAQRVAEMAPFMNRVIGAARTRGVLIIHSPSDCMGFYQGTPQRRRAQEAPLVSSPVPFKWNFFDPSREGPLDERLEKAGCSCDTPEPCGPDYRAWKRQTPGLEIGEPDAVSDSGQEVFNLLEARGIENVIVMGVHTNRCVLGRPFGIRQLAYLEKNVVLCRDLTDSYHRDPGRHFEGLLSIIEHVERYWCPTISSEAITGDPAFRFLADATPR